ncbi:MAG: PDZ domain-containing protein [Chitinophagaceae bacterium]|nr:PDZ domain-containing protein [Chitinophagaceae bacterium]MCW5925841.1 PDZ domain-containing protein [Chitinophagaceae bacterium]
MKIRFLVMAFSLAASAVAQTPELKRKADLGVRFEKLHDAPGVRVTQVMAGSPAEKAGLQAGDYVIQVNGVSLPDEYTLLKTIQKIKGVETVRLLVRRGDNLRTISFAPPPAAFETYNNLIVEPVIITNDFGDRLRAFVTKPKQATGRLPAILFVSWLSCSTIESTDLSDSWTKMLREVAEKTGAVMLRLEKPGIGDSEGPACADCDLATELNGYQAAIRYLKSRNDIDTTRLIIFGGSLGGTLTPIVGRDHPVKAYVSAVSVYKSWLEHMIELERRRLYLSGKTQSETTDLMQGYIEFHTTYLAGKKKPAQVMQEKPHLKELWYDEPAHQYGRPAKFYHQVQSQNFMKHWSEVKAPVLVVAGEFDWIMTLDDGKLLTELLNQKSPGQVTFLEGKGMDHHWMKYNNPVDAFNEKNGMYDAETVGKMIEWIRAVLK